jgi:ectoine hydroxylase-related dioxygenase (phytanoyl-CoA dioxygenase family)
MKRLAEWQPSRQALEEMQFGDFNHGGSLIVLTKEPYAPALYWHQDWMRWNDPLSCTPWPQTIFLSYYLEDTSVENGCLKVIPGTHLKRIPLHDQLVTAHEQGARFIEEDHPLMFSDHPDQVDVESKAGSLVLADARVLHAAYKNQTDRRRNLLLLWHNRPETVPDYWEDEIPQMVQDRDPQAAYPGTRIPGQYLPA